MFDCICLLTTVSLQQNYNLPGKTEAHDTPLSNHISNISSPLIKSEQLPTLIYI